ncbi:uncharacterized protein LOC111700745 [Eurytemora carolleeae]|uniref:uncharacterized protein LOC111700745 n=1 Tax=Eurytemora carolleeae TaxID=1294199 RepID=UPI000C764022|nr:uncharacterized protein LOC111700745 [Eurytemora carolleeae]|eukprot:XP_023327548.1 uncharacterized protein LOC111700745 [Eurytemora affinis]
MEKQESKVGGNEHAHSEVGTSRLNINSSVVWLPPKLRKSKTFPPVLSPCNASNLPLELSHTGASNVPPVFSPSNASNVPSELSFCDASNVPPESNLCDASNVPPESNSCDASNVSQSLYDVPVQLNRRRLSEPWNSTKRKAPAHQTTNHPQGRVTGGFINQSFEEGQPDQKLHVNLDS